MLKKSISVLLALVMLFSVVVVIPTSAYAEETADDGATDTGLVNNDLTVTGTNSLGSMLAAEYEENADESEASGSGVYAVEVVGKTARADIRTLVDAQLIISIFDEDGNIMYGSGMTDVTPDDSIVELTLEVDTMPQYFFIRAYLLDKVTNLPLCKQFENDYYTQQMQEFFAKTTDDFDEEKVLNLDDDDENNFMVYNDNTIIIEDEQGQNIISSQDNESKKYVIDEIDDRIRGLKPGDIFTYNDGNDVLIIKVASITINDDTAVIHGDDVELEEVFDFIRIEAAEGADEQCVDNSDIDEDLEYVGVFDDDDDIAATGADNNELSSSGYKLIDYSGSKSILVKYKFKEFDTNNDNEKPVGFKVSGSIAGKYDVSVSCYYDEKLTDREIKFSLALKYEMNLGVNFEFSAKNKWKLGKIDIPIIAGVIDVTFTPSFVVEGKITGGINGKITGQFGVGLSNRKLSNECKNPAFSAEINVAAEVFIGLSLEPAVEILAGAVKCKAEFKGGVVIKAEIKKTLEQDSSEIHLCTLCVDGTVSRKFEGSTSLIFLDNDKLEYKVTTLDRELKLFDCYYSIDNKEFGIGDCPHKSYKQTITILNKNKAPYAGVDVNGVKTSKNGVAVVYINGGKQTLTFEKDGKTVSKTKTIREAGKLEFTIDFDKPNSLGSMVCYNEGNITDSGQCGDNAYYTLTDTGLLTITGTGSLYSEAFIRNSKIKKVMINSGITCIGYSAFRYCDKLQSVTIPNSVTIIENGAFYQCKKLSSINIPNSVTDLGEFTFEGCTSLTNVILPNSITTIGGSMFAECSSLKDITIPNSITIIKDAAFRECTSLESITIPASVSTIICSGNGPTFTRCTSLTEINVDKNNSAYCSINGNLYTKDQKKLLNYAVGKPEKSFTVPNSVTTIGMEAFEGCLNLANVVIPFSVTSIEEYAFSGCSKLTDINIPDTVTSMGRCAFIDTAWYDNQPDGVVYAGKFAYSMKGTCPEEITFKNDTLHIADFAFATETNSSCKNIKKVTISESVRSIGRYAFSDCEELVALYIPKSVTLIGDGAVENCMLLYDIYYGGNEEDWSKIIIGDNYHIKYANIHYTSSGIASIGDRSTTGIAVTAAEIDHKTFDDFNQNITLSEITLTETGGAEPDSFVRSHLIPDTEAVLVILEGTENTVEFNSESLLFIAQDTVDENGSVSFDVNNDLGDTWVAYIFAECDHSSSSWQTAKQPAEGEEGLNILVCEHCGEVIGSEIIEALPVKYLLGDADGNGRIEVTDATSVQRFIASVETPYTKEELLRGDVDASGELEIIDVTAIQSYLAEISIPYLIGSDVV